LLIRSDRALGVHAYEQPARPQKEAVAPALAKVAPQPTPASRVEESAPVAYVSPEEPVAAAATQAPPEATPASPVDTEELEQSAPDISGLVKRASEVA